MGGVVAYDISRLFLGSASTSPRGIDRVDLALAEAVFANGDDGAVGVLPTPWGVRCYHGSKVRACLDHLRHAWSENRESALDPAWDQLRSRLKGVPNAEFDTHAVKGANLLVQIARLWALVRHTGFSLGRPVKSAVPKNAIYLNVGQIVLAVPFLFRWLEKRPDVTAVTMLHDVIPLEHPSCVTAASARHHAQMVRTTARYAHGLIVTTQHAQETVTTALAAAGGKPIPTLEHHLPLADAFAAGGNAHPDLVGVRYFVICGHVEPRKNHALLLEVWKRLLNEAGDDAPHLVVAGAPGWKAEEILSPLSDDQLRSRVHHVSGLSSPALRQLMIGAAGLLMPSLAEGFGLPVQEANALGVPVIASDIPAHREIAQAGTVLLPSDDIEAWLQAVTALPPGMARTAPATDARQQQAEYHRQVLAFARESAASRASRSSSAYGTVRRSSAEILDIPSPSSFLAPQDHAARI